MNRRDYRTRIWGGRKTAIIGVFLMVAIGFCLFHAVDDDGMSTDLCAGMLASIVVVLLVGLVMNGSLPPDVILAVRPVSIHLPDPPPRSPRF